MTKNPNNNFTQVRSPVRAEKSKPSIVKIMSKNAAINVSNL